MRKPGIYYQYRSEAETARFYAESTTNGGGWCIINARVLPRKSWGWIVCRSASHRDCYAVQICCKDGSMCYAGHTFDGMLRELPEDGDLPEDVCGC